MASLPIFISMENDSHFNRGHTTVAVEFFSRLVFSRLCAIKLNSQPVSGDGQMHYNLVRRRFLITGAIGATCLASGSLAALQPQTESTSELNWHDASKTGVEGKGWQDTERFFDRLPKRAKDRVRPEVWNLSRHSAGMIFRFRTDATTIHARYSLWSSRLDMNHMPATGVSGLDLYAHDDQEQESWLAVTQPTQQKVDVVIARDIDPLAAGTMRSFALYLPLYNGVDTLEIGVPASAKFEAITPRQRKPIVFYGTSIMHGACASRPGMSITGILGRRLGRPTINLGFSGNGRMESEVGQFLAELDAAAFVVDCLPNMNAQQVAERTEPLVKLLKQTRPQTPILLVEDRTFTNARFSKSRREHHAASRAALQQAFNSLVAQGVKDVAYLSGNDLLGTDGEAATDGSHPNDLGMIRYADAYERVLRPLLT